MTAVAAMLIPALAPGERVEPELEGSCEDERDEAELDDSDVDDTPLGDVAVVLLPPLSAAKLATTLGGSEPKLNGLPSIASPPTS